METNLDIQKDILNFMRENAFKVCLKKEGETLSGQERRSGRSVILLPNEEDICYGKLKK